MSVFLKWRRDLLVVNQSFTRPASSQDAELVHSVYVQTPKYFEIIAIEMPTLIEVKGELEAAERDSCRHTELILSSPDLPYESGIIEPKSKRHVLGFLDYKINYPETKDVTVNLLMVAGNLQAKGIGQRVMVDLEQRLEGRTRRVLASIYGRNTGATRFWKRMGYNFAIDAQPILDWYAKEL